MATQETDTPNTALSGPERFFKYFQQEATALQEQMERLGDTALIGGERKDATDHCLAGITRLRSEVKDASQQLPQYDLRNYLEATKALYEKLAELQAQHAPKQKFSFKTRKNESAISLHDAAELAAQQKRSALAPRADSGTSSYDTSYAPTPDKPLTPTGETAPAQHLSVPPNEIPRRSSPTLPTGEPLKDNQQRPILTTSATTTTISSQSRAHIILPASASRANTPCTLSKLESCCIDLSIPTPDTASFASLTISDVKSSLLLCSSVEGPAHITGVKNSTIVISCRQLRMHGCDNVDVYLYCTSRPIIEDCKGIGFSEMPSFYTDMLHSVAALSNQAIGTNMWDKVDDFKWLRSEQSPNWMITTSDHQISEEKWKQIIPARPGMSVDEILQSVSIDT